MRSNCSTLNARAFGLASGTASAAVSAICALALKIAPDGVLALLGYLIHADVSGLTPAVSWTSFFASVTGWGVFAGLTFSAVAVLYNQLSSAAVGRPHATVGGVAS